MRGDPRQLITRFGRGTESRGGAESVAATESETRELRDRIVQQWAEVRATRRAMDTVPSVTGGASNFSAARVPYGVDLASAWAWRSLVIGAALGVILFLLNFFLVVVLPVVIALLLAALAVPVVSWLQRLGLPRKVAALLVVAVGLGVIVLLVTFVSNQVVSGASDLSQQVGSGVQQIRDWLRTGPLHVTDSQITSTLDDAQETIANSGTEALGRVTEVGTALTHIVAGLFIVLFSTYFFLADGALIWSWMVRLFPRAGRLKADSSGRVAWRSLTQFVRATVLVAATDAIGTVVWAAILGLPFLSAIGILVFLGAFVPMIGATVSGTVAVLVALVAKGPTAALIMLVGVVFVQQVEAHVLQPFLMGRFVSVHPLGVIVAIAMGVIVAGIPGALIAVPLAASVNAVVQHLASETAVGMDAEQGRETDSSTPTEDQGERALEAVEAEATDTRRDPF